MRSLIATLLLLVMLPLEAAANAPAWAEPYNRGVAAAQRQAWAEAADALQKAIAANPQEELNANSGTRAINYLPHYWLGVARLNLGDAQGALSSLKRSESQGVIQRTDQYAAFRRALSRAQTTGSGSGDTKAMRKPADDAIARALVAQTIALGAGSSRRSEYQLADRKLEQAVASLRGTPTATQIQSATKLADEATKLYESVSRPTKPVVVQKVSPTPGLPPQGRETVAPPADEGDPAQRARVEQEIRELEAAAAQGLSRNSGTKMKAVAESVSRSADSWRAEIETGVPEERLAAISLDISRKMREVGAAGQPAIAGPGAATGPKGGGTTTPPGPGAGTGNQTNDQTGRQLRTAFAALTDGRLNDSERILDALIAGGRGVGAVYALRGCVRYTRALLGEGQPLVAAAQSDFATAIRMDPAIRLDGRYFSPKVVALFDQTRRQQ